MVLESTEITVLSEDVLGGCRNAALLVHPVLLAAGRLHPWLLGLNPAFSPSVRSKHTPSKMGGFLLPILIIFQEGHCLSRSWNYWGRVLIYDQTMYLYFPSTKESHWNPLWNMIEKSSYTQINIFGSALTAIWWISWLGGPPWKMRYCRSEEAFVIILMQ